jgi:class 3 adenylate cyclase
MKNACGQAYSFHVNDAFSFHVTNELATLLGEGDSHDVGYDHIEASFSFDSLDHTDSYFLDGTNAKSDRDFCLYSLHIYPTDQLQKQYVTFKPALYTASTAFVFLFIFIVSIAYERRVAQLIESGVEYRAIVANLFPAVVRERLFRSKGKERNLRDKQKNRRRRSSDIPKPILRTRTARFLREDEKKEAGDQIVDNDDWTQMSKPIADLFEHTTVLFADIAGFTSWSSGREPEHVFTLLQTLFNAFDRVARKRGVFKVETIGDCYMAVTGLPAVQEDHAIRMTKFARECLMRVSAILVRLQGTLGPDTGDLNMRFGLHSGPVTAGVLQGEKSRFQLFGDTVNTASRMESTGEVGRLHISKTTAGLLIEGGKGHWLEKRKEAVHAKGKGIVETYWVVGSTRTLNQGKQRRTSNESERLSDTEKMTASYSTMSAASTFNLNDSNWELLAAGNLMTYHTTQ